MGSVPRTSSLLSIEEVLDMLQLLLQPSRGAVVLQLLLDLREVLMNKLVQLSDGGGFVEFVLMFL